MMMMTRVVIHKRERERKRSKRLENMQKNYIHVSIALESPVGIVSEGRYTFWGLRDFFFLPSFPFFLSLFHLCMLLVLGFLVKDSIIRNIQRSNIPV